MVARAMSHVMAIAPPVITVFVCSNFVLISSVGANCTSNKQVCDGYNCVDCNNDSDCLNFHPSLPVCASKKCVQCIYDIQCPNGTHCDTRNNVCVECRSNLHCMTNTTCGAQCNISSQCTYKTGTYIRVRTKF